MAAHRGQQEHTTQDAQKGRPLRLWFVWFIWFLWLVLFNQTNETNQINQITVFLRWWTFSASCQVVAVQEHYMKRMGDSVVSRMPVEEAGGSGRGLANNDVRCMNRLYTEKVYTCDDAPDRNAYSEKPKTPGDTAREVKRTEVHQNQQGGKDG